MSRQNTVNRDAYVQRGRLTQDDMARQRLRQREAAGATSTREQVVNRGSRPRPAGAGEPIPRRNARGE